MIKPLCWLLAALLPAAGVAGITEVTLYPDHGLLVWEEPVRVQTGSGRLDITGLPAGLDDRSLQVTLTGSDKVRIQQVQTTRVEQTDVVAERTRELRQALQELNDRIGAMEDEIQAWRQQIRLTDQVAETPGESVTASELDALAETLQSRTGSALARIREIRQQLRGPEAERDRLERELEQVSQAVKATKTVSVSYQAIESAGLTARLTFQTPEAHWQSRYNARLDSREDQVQLEHQAVVRQNSGVDWSDVRLRLSTLSARAGSGLPRLLPWIVTPAPQPEHRKEALAMMRSDAMEASVPQVAQVSEEGPRTQIFEFPGRVSIASDGGDQTLTVSQVSMPVEVATHMAPAILPLGYVYASGVYIGQASLPAGPVTLFRDGQSVGSGQLAPLQPDSTLSLGFGTDDRVSVHVVREEEQQGEEGIFKGEKYLRRMNRYDVTNHHPGEVSIRVLDRLPVSRHDSIKIEYQGISEPVQMAVDDKPGVIAWERSLAAGETLTLKAGFEIRVPEDQELPPL
jgi:uncharacterized protein (TIGR02231 family)